MQPKKTTSERDELKEKISQKDAEIAKKDDDIAKKDDEIAKNKTEIAKKDAEIEHLRSLLANRDNSN